MYKVKPLKGGKFSVVYALQPEDTIIEREAFKEGTILECEAFIRLADEGRIIIED